MTPEYNTLTTGPIHISSQKTNTYRASYKKDDGHYLIPFDRHPYHGKATNVFCEVLQLETGTQLVFPHWVLLQRYFSSCPFLFTQLFQFGIQLDTLYDSSKSKLDSGLGRIHLKKWTYDMGASEIARIAWDPSTRNAYSMVSDHLSICKSNQWPTTPKTKFPFSDTTNLTVRGKHLPCDRGTPSFIVFEILDCTAGYPFDSLLIDRDNPGSLNRSNTTVSRSNSVSHRSHKKIPRANNTLNLAPAEEPSSNFESLNIAARPRAPLSGLAGKQISKIKRDASTSNELSANAIYENIESGNTGHGWQSGDGAPISFVRDPNTQVQPSGYVFTFPVCRLKTFRQSLALLNTKSWVKTIRFVPVNPSFGKSEGIFSFFPDTLTKSGRKRKWRYIGYVKGNESRDSRLRRALIAEIATDSTNFYVIEIERRIAPTTDARGWLELDNPAMLIAYPEKGQHISIESLKTLLEQCAEQSGTWLRRDEAYPKSRTQDYMAKTLKHPSNQSITDLNQYHTEIVKIIESAINLARKGEEVFD